jgi:16S rRNA C1402 N4-methylase RsmH
LRGQLQTELMARGPMLSGVERSELLDRLEQDEAFGMSATPATFSKQTLIKPSADDIADNARAASAQLRVVTKL